MPNFRMFVLLLGGLPLLFSCAGREMVARDPLAREYFASAAAIQAPTEGPLFSSDASVMSDEEIQRALSFRYAPQRQNRIGVVTVGRRYWYGYSDELSRAGTEVQTKVISSLRRSSLVYDASYLPALLTPERRTVGHFREAGARYQADLLLIYQPSCRTYEKYQFFSPDKSKSYCTVEAVLLDTRSGVVPFTATASRDVLAEKTEKDLSLQETIRRAEVTALGDALDEIATGVVRFLEAAGK